MIVADFPYHNISDKTMKFVLGHSVLPVNKADQSTANYYFFVDI